MEPGRRAAAPPADPDYRLEPDVPGRQRDPVAFLPLFEQGVREPEQARQELLDVGRDHNFERGARLEVFDLVIEPAQHHGRAGAGAGQGVRQLLLRG